MWIETTNTDSDGNPVTERLRHPEVSEDIVFTENGKAQVTRDVGEQACGVFDSVVPVEAASDGADGAADEDTTDDTGAD